MAQNRANLRSRVLGGSSSSSGSPKTNNTEELVNESGPPDPKSQDSFANRPHISGGDIERAEPPKDRMRRYWRQFETTPIVREPITSFARQVVEPGYYIETDVLDQQEKQRMMRWLNNAAIIGGKRDRDIRKLLKKAAVQREVRGTVLVEKVPAKENNDILYGVKLINPESIEVHTMPRQALLLPPERPEEIFDDEDSVNIGDVPTTQDGLAAAYEQDMQTNRWRRDDEFKKYWTADEIIPLTRDADVGEVYGTSRLEAASARIEGLKKKLQDNDEAIASKAYPLWLFLFGSEESPWERDDIDRFMNAHDMDNFQPGLKQGVRGDVSVETISGDVADIAEYLQYDLDYIMSSMPMPKYTLGAFENQINQFVSRSQERDVQRQLKEARREMEEEFSEIVQEKAQEMFGLSEEDATKVNFKMGLPNEENEVVAPDQNIIDYRGKNDNEEEPQPGQSSDSGNPNRGQPSNSEPQPDGAQQDSKEENIWTAELSDPRFVSTTAEQRDLYKEINEVFKEYVDTTVSRLRSNFRNAPRSAMTQLPTVLAQSENQAFRRASLEREASETMQNVVTQTLQTLADDTNMEYQATYNSIHKNNTRQFTRNVQRAVENAVDDLAKRVEQQVTNAVQSGEEMQNVIERVRGTFTRRRLRQRAKIIAHMELQRAVNVTKLVEFENQDEVIGVKAINSCEGNTTQVCSDLAGCDGEPAVAYFDEEESLAEQWMDNTRKEHLHTGFDPIPETPPWHFNCDTELVPVVKGDSGTSLTHAPLQEDEEFTVADLEEKYGMRIDNNA
jgi:hypothetical protein